MITSVYTYSSCPLLFQHFRHCCRVPAECVGMPHPCWHAVLPNLCSKVYQCTLQPQFRPTRSSSQSMHFHFHKLTCKKTDTYIFFWITLYRNFTVLIVHRCDHEIPMCDFCSVLRNDVGICTEQIIIIISKYPFTLKFSLKYDIIYKQNPGHHSFPTQGCSCV